MARRNIVERYIRADIEKRVEIILDNYGMFNRILDGYEQTHIASKYFFAYN